MARGTGHRRAGPAAEPNNSRPCSRWSREEEGRQADMALGPLPPLCRRAWQVAVAYTPQSAPPLTAVSPTTPPVRAAFHNGTLRHESCLRGGNTKGPGEREAMTYYRLEGLSNDAQQIRRSSRRPGRRAGARDSCTGALPAGCFRALPRGEILPLLRQLASGEAGSQFLIGTCSR